VKAAIFLACALATAAIHADTVYRSVGPDGMRAFVEAGEVRGVPVMLFNGQRVQGFSRGAYDALFVGAR
jgi:hypothetical protein